MKIETATKPAGVAPAAGDWALMFHGLIDRIAWADSPVRVECRDLFLVSLSPRHCLQPSALGCIERGRLCGNPAIRIG